MEKFESVETLIKDKLKELNRLENLSAREKLEVEAIKIRNDLLDFRKSGNSFQPSALSDELDSAIIRVINLIDKQFTKED